MKFVYKETFTVHMILFLTNYTQSLGVICIWHEILSTEIVIRTSITFSNHGIQTILDRQCLVIFRSQCNINWHRRMRYESEDDEMARMNTRRERSFFIL